MPFLQNYGIAVEKSSIFFVKKKKKIKKITEK